MVSMATVRTPAFTRSSEVSTASMGSGSTSARDGVVNTQPLKPNVSMQAHAPTASAVARPDLPVPFIARIAFSPDSTQLARTRPRAPAHERPYSMFPQLTWFLTPHLRTGTFAQPPQRPHD